MSAYIKVSGTYFPPNFPKRPKESGLGRRVVPETDPFSSLGRCSIWTAGSRVPSVQETAKEEYLAVEGQDEVNLRKLKGNLEGR